jgi:hypothetical protein
MRCGFNIYLRSKAEYAGLCLFDGFAVAWRSGGQQFLTSFPSCLTLAIVCNRIRVGDTNGQKN